MQGADFLSEFIRRYTQGKTSSHRRKDVSTVEGSADRLPPEARVRNSRRFKSLLEHHLRETVSLFDQWHIFFRKQIIDYVAENAIVGSNKDSRSRFEYHSPALTAHARVYNSHVNCLLGEVAVSSIKYESSLKDVLRPDRMTDVHDTGSGVDVQDGPFHSSNVGIIITKVGGQGYYGTHCAAIKVARIMSTTTKTMVSLRRVLSIPRRVR